MDRAEAEEKSISQPEALRLAREHLAGHPFEPKSLTKLLFADAPAKSRKQKKGRNSRVIKVLSRLVEEGSIEKTGFGSFYRVVSNTDAAPLQGAFVLRIPDISLDVSRESRQLLGSSE